MSIRDRIEDAKLLWRDGRKEGAFIQILITAAATARKRYPRPPKGVKPVPANQRPQPGEYANDSNAFKTFILDEMEKITGGPKYGVAFPEFWMWNLARVVAQAPENQGLFADYPINNQLYR